MAISLPTFADTTSPSLRFYAVNAGYKDDSSSQNYDYIELERLSDSNLSLASYRIVYTNSSGNYGGEITFSDNLLLSAERLILGATVNPQFNTADGSYYIYNFGSSGLASTAGMLELYQGEAKIDEICWGKITCAANYPKFATKFEDNYSLVRCSDNCEEDVIYSSEKYYPEPNFEALSELTTTDNSAPEPSCEGIIITEIFSYYIDSVSEQFIELYNPTPNEIPLETCSIHYKNTTFKLKGLLASGVYYLLQDSELALTKNPTSFNLVSVEDSAGNVIDSVSYPHGQKKGASFALFEISSDSPFWRQSYFPTPNAANIYQEFQSCPSGKVINPTTGNCIKEANEAATTSCPAGKYLNPLTNRCKKIANATSLTPCKEGYERNPDTNRCRKIVTATTAELTPCKDGYERNPETNRCRKIRENTGESADYAPTPANESNYYNPKVFIATTAICVALVGGLIYVVYQYRQEIRKVFRNIIARFRKV